MGARAVRGDAAGGRRPALCRRAAPALAASRSRPWYFNLVGGVVRGRVADDVRRAGLADCVALARPLVDPHDAAHAAASRRGAPADVRTSRPCVDLGVWRAAAGTDRTCVAGGPAPRRLARTYGAAERLPDPGLLSLA